MTFSGLLKKIRSTTSFLQRELFLLSHMPKSYIYSFTYSPTDKIKIQDYDEKIKRFGESLVKEVHALMPTQKVHFMGSAALELPGQRDIDLWIEAKPDQFNEFVPKLIEIFGLPKKHKKSFVEWETELNTYSIDLIMCEPSNEILKGPLEVFNALKSSKKHLKEYLAIKLASNNISVREYKKRRLLFFNKLRFQQ